MTIRVAALAPKELLGRVVEASSAFPEMAIVPCGYGDAGETKNLVRKVAPNVDAYFFNGPAPARLAYDIIPRHAPRVTARYDVAAVAQTLFRVHRELPEAFSWGISISSLGEREADELAAELGLERDKLIRYNLQDSWECEAIASFHRDLLRKRVVAASVIGLRSAYKQLNSEGLPVYDVRPTRAAIRDALSDLVSMAKARRDPQDDLAVMVIAPSDPTRCGPQELQRVREYVAQLAGAQETVTLHLGTYSLSVVGNLQELRHLAGLDYGGTLTPAVYATTGAAVRIGFGSGGSLQEANRRAYLALECGTGNGITTVTSYHGEKMADTGLHTLAPTRLPISSLRRGLAPKRCVLQARTVKAALGKPQVSSVEVAGALKITERSARRLLLAWSDWGLAEVIGQDTSGQPGRPRQVYEFRI